MNKIIQTLIFGLAFFSALHGFGKKALIDQDREEVLLRKIGHEILLQANDSTSLVLPILKEKDTYRIQFETHFSFQAEAFIYVVDSLIKNSHVEKSYLLKVEKCKTEEVVYSYEVDIFAPDSLTDQIACKSRPYPEDCYEVVLKFFDNEKEEQESDLGWVFILLGGVLFIVFIVLFRQRKIKAKEDKNTIKLGGYLYDPKKMVLIRQEKIIELTSKESDLLNLLYASANETVERDIILNKVWGDEGDYVGRTLDVYISKLRKKLESDSSIELKNIRGIGYKLIIED